MARSIAGTRPISRNARSSVWRIVTRLRKSLGNKVEASMICHAHLRVVLCCISAGLMSLAGGAVLAADASKNETSEASPPYELGSGVRLWNSGFYLGGYGSIEYSAAKNAEPDFALSHADLFFWWENRSGFKFFFEGDGGVGGADHPQPQPRKRAT